MSRIQPIQPTEASDKSKKLLDGVQRGLGMVPNMVKTMAHSPATLAGYVNFNQALSGALTPALREQISLAVAGINGCDYCASAHTLLGRNVGITEEELAANLAATSHDEKTQAGLTFAQRIVEQHGQVTDDDLMLARTAEYTEAQVVEIVAVVSLNIFTNYLNLVAETEIDFPVVETAPATTF